VERLLAGGTDGRVLFIAGGAVESDIAVCKRAVDEVRSTLGADEALLVPVLVLETDILRRPTHGQNRVAV